MHTSPKKFFEADEVDMGFGKVPLLIMGGTWFDQGRFIAEYFGKDLIDMIGLEMEGYLRTGIAQKREVTSLMMTVQTALDAIMPFISRESVEEIAGFHQGLSDLGISAHSQKIFERAMVLVDMGERRCAWAAVQPPASKDGNTYFFRLVDVLGSLGYHNFAYLTVRFPQDENGELGSLPYFALEMAGGIGTVCGMNMQGLALGHVSAAMRHPAQLAGEPLLDMMRKGLTECKNSEEARRFIEASPRTTCEVFAAADSRQKSDSIQTFLYSPVRFYATPAGEMLQNDYLADDAYRFYKPLEGVAYWAGISQSKGKKKIGPKTFYEMLLPKLGEIDEQTLMQVASELAHSESVAAFVFDLSRLKIWACIARDEAYATTYPFASIDLSSICKKYLPGNIDMT